MVSSTNLFELLLTKSILAILDGDTDFGEIKPDDGSEPIRISMPYLSGPNICEISSIFGFPASYDSQSRWVYMYDLIKHCIEKNKVYDLLTYLFSKKQYVEKLKGKTPALIDILHKKIIETVIQQINGILFFGGNELVTTGNNFQIKAINSSIVIADDNRKNSYSPAGKRQYCQLPCT